MFVKTDVIVFICNITFNVALTDHFQYLGQLVDTDIITRSKESGHITDKVNCIFR